MARILNIGAENAPDTALSIRFAFKLKNEIKAFTLAVRNRRFYSTHSFETNGHSMLNLSRNLLASFIGLSILAACGVSDNATPNPRVATSNLITEIGEYYGALTETQRQTLSACDVDQKEFRRLMNLNYKSFDQDFVGGWRAVSAVEGCKSAATILLQVYLLRQKTVFEDNRSTLRWHTGQVLAGNGQTEDAIRYFEQTYKPDDEDQVEWNL